MPRDVTKDWPGQSMNPRWISLDATVIESNVAGTGVVANGRIEKGAPVAVIGGVIVPRGEIMNYRQEHGHVGIQINDGFFIVPQTREELQKFGVFNHSCKPNIGFSDSLTLVAIEDIEPGSELSFDYAFSETKMDAFQCQCGESCCRGTVTDKDWMIDDIQTKYGPYFSPYLKEKIAAIRGPEIVFRFDPPEHSDL